MLRFFRQKRSWPIDCPSLSQIVPQDSTFPPGVGIHYYREALSRSRPTARIFASSLETTAMYFCRGQKHQLLLGPKKEIERRAWSFPITSFLPFEHGRANRLLLSADVHMSSRFPGDIVVANDNNQRQLLG